MFSNNNDDNMTWPKREQLIEIRTDSTFEIVYRKK